MIVKIRILITFSICKVLIFASSFETDTPFFASPIQNTTARLGDEARLACIVENLGPYQVAWFHQASGAVLTVGERVLTSNTRITVTREQRNTWVLGINNVTRSDAGQYMCQVSTSPPRKLFGHLSIVEPPTFEWHSQIARVREGQTAVLECHARGFPNPTILWKREDNEYIRVNSTFDLPTYRGSKLLLSEASPRTSGSFICVASNGHPPSVSRVLSLKVIHSPRVEFMSAKDTLWVTRGDTVTLSCRYSAYPLPRVVFHVENFQRLHNWSHTHFEIKPLRHQFPFTHVMTLTIPRITSFDFGNHSCIVRNDEGEDYDSIMVREKFSTTTTTSTTILTTIPTTVVPDHEIEGRGPIPLRDGSFTSSENHTSTHIAQPTSSVEDSTGRIKVKKKNTTNTTEGPWTKKIARINLSNSTKNYARIVLRQEWKIIQFSILLILLFWEI